MNKHNWQSKYTPAHANQSHFMQWLYTLIWQSISCSHCNRQMARDQSNMRLFCLFVFFTFFIVFFALHSQAWSLSLPLWPKLQNRLWLARHHDTHSNTASQHDAKMHLGDCVTPQGMEKSRPITTLGYPLSSPPPCQGQTAAVPNHCPSTKAFHLSHSAIELSIHFVLWMRGYVWLLSRQGQNLFIYFQIVLCIWPSAMCWTVFCLFFRLFLHIYVSSEGEACKYTLVGIENWLPFSRWLSKWNYCLQDWACAGLLLCSLQCLLQNATMNNYSVVVICTLQRWYCLVTMFL